MTAVTNRPRYDWVRLTYPHGQAGGIRVDEHGWFVPVPWYFADRLTTFASLDQVRDEPVVLLMSASGIGKSTALLQEGDALTPSASCLVDLCQHRLKIGSGPYFVMITDPLSVDEEHALVAGGRLRGRTSAV